MALGNYYVVYNSGIDSGGGFGDERKFKKGKLLGVARERAEIIKLEAESVAEAQEIVKEAFAASTSLPVVVTEAQWKTS